MSAINDGIFLSWLWRNCKFAIGELRSSTYPIQLAGVKLRLGGRVDTLQKNRSMGVEASTAPAIYRQFVIDLLKAKQFRWAPLVIANNVMIQWE